jgi:hypothetical protein
VRNSLAEYARSALGVALPSRLRSAVIASTRLIQRRRLRRPMDVFQVVRVGVNSVEERQHALGEQRRSGGVVGRERGVGEDVLAIFDPGGSSR